MVFALAGARLERRCQPARLLAGSDRGRSHGEGALGFDEGLAPVAVAQAIDPDTAAAAAAGVDELVVTEVDPGVADATATTVGAEEQQVTGLQLVTVSYTHLTLPTILLV